MNDVFTERTRRGWGSRLKESLGGVVVGLLMFAGAFPLQWWNEGRAVERRESLIEGAAAVIAADAARVDPANEGRLVHVAGRVEAPGTLRDPELAVEREALALAREVEMYQWREKRETREEKKLGGGTEEVTTYRYEREWSDELIDSSDFRRPEGHVNPSAFPIASHRVEADAAQLGAWRLGPELRAKLRDWRRVPLGDALLEVPEGWRVVDGRLFRGADPARPAIGDLRIGFREVPEADYSLVARQAGDGLASYRTRRGGEILLVESGIHAPAAMFDQAQRSNTMMTWVLRAAGLAMMWLGLYIALRPVVVLADVVPLFGRVVAAGVGFVGFVLAAAFSLVTIALAWLWYRPALGGALLLAAVAVLLLLRRRGAGPPPAPAMTPPPPPPPRAT